MKSKIKFTCILLTAYFLTTSCYSTYNYVRGTVKYNPKKDIIFTKPSLKKYLKNVKNPSIVLRVPNEESSVLEKDGYSSSAIYSTIEKELSKAGFLVRDRGLFKRIIQDNRTADYSEIGSKTKTALILEVVKEQNVDFITNKYTNKRGKEKTAPFFVKYRGMKVEFKIIKVDENDVVGNYVFYYTPCVSGCSRAFIENRGSLPIESTIDFVSYMSIKHEYTFDKTREEVFYEDCAKRLIRSLKE